MTGEAGKFALTDLDPELLFQLLVYRDGFAPTYSKIYLDPRLGEVELPLPLHDLATREPERVLRGRIRAGNGEPIARATISPVGRVLGGRQQFGGLDGVDELALSDERGEFALGVSRSGEGLLVSIEARGYAPRMSPWLRAGPEPHDLVLVRGTTVTGVVLRGDEPLGGVELGLVQEDRGPEGFTGERTVGTDAAGRFTFVNVPPDQAWQLYGKMASFKTHGALPSRTVRTPGAEATLDVGRLLLEPGARLSGRVALADGEPLPEGLRVLLSREHAWDTQVARLDENGAFAFEGLPRELYTLDTRLDGYVVSPANLSCDLLNRMGLIGRIEGDIADLVLLLEPGEPQTHFSSADIAAGAFERYEALQSAPLRGAPAEAAAPVGPR